MVALSATLWGGEMSQQTTGIKLEPELKERLRHLSEKMDRSPHWLIKTAVVEYLEREERYEQERQEDEARWQHFQLTGRAHSHRQALDHFHQLKQRSRANLQEPAAEYRPGKKPPAAKPANKKK